MSGVSGDLGGCTGLTLVLKGLVDLDLCTEEALEPRFPFPLELEMESRSSALPIFSNMARALLNRAWWLSVLETEATTEVLGNSLITGDISLVLDFFLKTTVSLFWNLLAIWDTKPSLIGLVGAKTPPPASVDSLCFICNKHMCLVEVTERTTGFMPSYESMKKLLENSNTPILVLSITTSFRGKYFGKC